MPVKHHAAALLAVLVLAAMSSTEVPPANEMKPDPEAAKRSEREKLWAGPLTGILPPGWQRYAEGTVSQKADAPFGWTRTRGEGGIGWTIPFAGDKNPDGRILLYAMPVDWAGHTADAAEKMEAGVYTPPAKPDDRTPTAWAIGSDGARQVFMLIEGWPEIRTPYGRDYDPYMEVADHLGLKMRFAPLADIDVTEVSYGYLYATHRTFTADGWVNAGHISGGPAPFVHMEKALVPPARLIAILKAAAEVEATSAAPEAKPEMMDLAIAHKDGRRVVLRWAARDEAAQPTDPKVQALLKLVHEVSYGAW
jgi:hypothetical protein